MEINVVSFVIWLFEECDLPQDEKVKIRNIIEEYVRLTKGAKHDSKTVY